MIFFRQFDADARKQSRRQGDARSRRLSGDADAADAQNIEKKSAAYARSEART